jgi:hypothetical protein
VLFTGAKRTADRLNVAVAGTVVSFHAGFGYDATGNLVLDTASAPAAFVKGIGVTTAGAVTATTSTAATDTFSEGVRIAANGQLVYALASPTNFASGNPVTATGALACV